MSYRYEIRRSPVENPLAADWDSPVWNAAATAQIDNFRVESSDHHPVVRARVLYTPQGLYTRFRVEDRYVRCVAEKLNDSVCLDSCVEFFIEPAGNKGYLNFEFSGSGAFLCFHVRDPRRTATGFEDFSATTPEQMRHVVVTHSLPSRVEPEITEPTTWELGFFAPFELFHAIIGNEDPTAGTVWRGNFFKCGDKTSHPHWASWAPVPQLNFHEPAAFGELVFAK